MSAPDFLPLSLLPLWRWRRLAEQLRAGLNPRDLLDEHCLDQRRRNPASPGAEALRARANVLLEDARRHRLTAVSWIDPAYPALLAAIPDPPPVLWVRGEVAALNRRAVALVGSRAGSPYAIDVAYKLAADLAAQGIAVVSGLARGVDSSAHRGALAGNGCTLAVLGCGANIVYPREHADLAEAIAATGAVVSELPPGTPPRSRFFPRRNRIISGLSQAVVIVEAGEKSGSLITARAALDQGRDVLAVPGNVLSGRNRGGHALLRDGARLVETADDVLDEMGIVPRRDGRAADGTEAETAMGGRSAADPVLMHLIPGEASDLDGLQARSGLPADRLLARLSELELCGCVKRVGGGRFVRV